MRTNNYCCFLESELEFLAAVVREFTIRWENPVGTDDSFFPRNWSWNFLAVLVTVVARGVLNGRENPVETRNCFLRRVGAGIFLRL